MEISARFAIPQQLHVGALVFEQGGVTILASPQESHPRCPECGHSAHRVHSRYSRTIADLPWGGVPVCFRVQIRKLYCDNPNCPRRIFAERLDGVARQYARRTDRQREALDLIAFALGGEAGPRLAVELGLRISPDTLLNYIRLSPEACQSMPRVLGVDDWAIRKAYSYGTVLVDLERRRIVDLLPNRSGDTLARWLQNHPGVEVVSRDRASAYAEGVERGLPGAVQVADRFHLLQNLVAVVERVLDRNRKHLQDRSPPAGEAGAAPETSVHGGIFGDHVRDLPREEQARRHRRLDRLARYEEAADLKRKGLTLDEIADRVGLGRRTLIRWFQADGFPERKPRSDRGSPGLRPYLSYLERRWREGCRNVSRLWREIRAQGFDGSYDAVYAWSRGMRRLPEYYDGRRSPPSSRRYSPRQAGWLFLREENLLTSGERRFLDELLGQCPDAADTYRLARGFARMVKRRESHGLEGWLRDAETSRVKEMRGFARGMRRDESAVRAALTLPWSNGQVEGQIHRLKLIKRQMYGRANLDLLRKRVLRAA